MIYIIIGLIFIAFVFKLIIRIIPILAKLQTQRKITNSDERAIIKKRESLRQNKLINNISISQEALDALLKKYYYLDDNHEPTEQANDYPIREKIFISKKEFRFKGEEDYIIRVDQKPPDDFKNKIYEKVMLKGISYSSRHEIVNSFIFGANHILLLKRSPSNQDKFGIKVVGIWQSTRKIRQAQLGWVPVIEASQIWTTYPKDMPLVATLRKIYKPRPDKHPGMRYDIWIP